MTTETVPELCRKGTVGHNEELASRVRAALAYTQHLEAKKMFGGITLMVGGRMCVSVGSDRLMCRIDPRQR